MALSLNKSQQNNSEGGSDKQTTKSTKSGSSTKRGTATKSANDTKNGSTTAKDKETAVITRPARVQTQTVAAVGTTQATYEPIGLSITFAVRIKGGLDSAPTIE